MAWVLVNLPPFVLGEIFKKLDTSDFISMYESTKNPNIRQALQLAFQSKFRFVLFTFYLFQRITINNVYNGEHNCVRVLDYAMCQKLVKYFGKGIKKLDLTIVTSHCRNDQNHFAHLLRSICKFCKNIEFLHFRQTNTIHQLIIMGLVCPIASIRELSFFHCNVNGQCNSLDYWFPNIRSLSFLYINTLNGHGKIFSHTKYEFFAGNTYLCGNGGNTRDKCNQFIATQSTTDRIKIVWLHKSKCYANNFYTSPKFGAFNIEQMLRFIRPLSAGDAEFHFLKHHSIKF